MARKVETIEHVLDDLDGTAASETLTFAVEGVSYQIDLNKKNAKALRTDFAKWASSARKVKGKTTTRTARRSSAPKLSESAAIRAWAAKSGVDVNARGRIPAAVIAQYHSSN